MKTKGTIGGHTSERGTALAMMVLCVGGLAALSAALMSVGLSSSREQRGEREGIHARYVAQAGLSMAMHQMQQGESGVVGTQLDPVTWGAAQVWVSSEDLGGGLVRLRATGIDDRSGASQELVAREVPNTIWRFGAFGREFLRMDSNARVDSYDSRLGTYAAQAVNGSGASLWARANGDVGSNGHVRVEQNAKVWGDALSGPSDFTEVLGNAVVSGSTGNNTAIVEMPDINVPTYTDYGSVTISANTTVPSSNRQYGNLVVGNNKTLTIVGPANFVVTNLTLRSGSQIVVDATNGPVVFYVLDDFVVNSNAMIASTTRDPRAVALNLLSDNVINPEVAVDLDQVDFDSNSKVYGTIYAPSAAIVIDSNFELFGSILARSVDIDSNASFHFDEALIDATATGVPTFETVLWRDIAFQGGPDDAGSPGGAGAQQGQTAGN